MSFANVKKKKERKNGAVFIYCRTSGNPKYRKSSKPLVRTYQEKVYMKATSKV